MKYELINSQTKAEDIISLVFENRNIDEKEIFDYIQCDKDFRTNPYDYVNMDKAVELFKKHIENKSSIYILCDCDCDGYSSATLTYKLAKELDEESNVEFIHHEGKRHGLYNEIIDRIKNLNIDLLIIPDAASNQLEELRIVKDLGIDILVIDHHEAKYADDLLIVNNQYNDINKGLSGAAMVLKFAEAIIGEKSKKFMDLAAISLISDSMPMNNLENRYYVKNGLSNITNSFFSKLVENKKEISSSDVSFNISPTINSIIRMGTIEDKIILMSALTEKEGEVELPVRKNGKKMQNYNYIDAAIKISKWRRTEQRDLVELESSKIEIEHENPINIILLDKDFNLNIAGYFANVVSGKNLKPTLALKQDDDGMYKGSARGAYVDNFKDFLLSSNLFETCEGHQGAFGVEIKEENLNKFKSNIKDLELPKETTYKVDAIFKSQEVKRENISAINSLENLWGKGMEKPLFAIKLQNVTFSIIGANQNTIRIMKDGITYIKFNCSEREIMEIQSLKGMYDVNVVGYFDVNVFNAFANYQIKIRDYEILSKSKEQNIFEDMEYFEDLF